MKIILSICRGRLGNEIFQFANVLNYASNSKNYIICINYNNIYKIFNKDFKNIKLINFKINSPIFRFFEKIISLLINNKIITSISPKIKGTDYRYESNILVVIYGLLKNIIYLDGFFQSKKFISNINKLNINNNLIDFYKKYKSNYCKNDKLNIFIHFRRTDYASFLINGNSIVLPDTYYLNAINAYKKMNSNLFFHVFADEKINLQDYGLNNINSVQPNITNANEIFTIMSCLDGGIIANSSLSYIAACYGNRFGNEKLYIAPINHLGYNFNIEIPHGIYNEDFLYIE